MTEGVRPATAQYLLRLDDLCPTMNKAVWRRCVPLVRRYGIRPILAVIPDNQDGEFLVEAPDAGFWDEIRAFEAEGATIGLHGYQHVCNSVGRSLMPLHRQSEFAGAPERFQREWIGRGLGILRGQGLHPGVWVAPRHGFDRTTVKILIEEGIGVVSDGFAARPYRWLGMTWIPQQLWGPVAKDSGLWTICLHPSLASERVVEDLERFLEGFAGRFTSVERVLAEWPAEERSVADRLFHLKSMVRIGVSRARRRIRRRLGGI